MTTRLLNEVTVHYTTSAKCEIENGQGDGICTRTVRVTGGDANCYITTLKNGAPGRTRTDEYGFTKPAL